jgi:hypothetical protein
MDTPFVLGLNKVLCAGYFLLIAWVNCTMFLISSFYRKKFNQQAPRYGFIASIIFTMLYVASLFFTVSLTGQEISTFTLIQMVIIVGAAIASGWSSVNLFIVMKRARKF